MKVTFVIPFAGLQGGIRVVAILADLLKRRGHQVLVISTPQQVSLRWKMESFLTTGRWDNHSEPSHFDKIDVEHRVLEQVRPVTDADVPDADVVVAVYYRIAYGVLGLSPKKGAKVIFLQGYEVEAGKPNPRLDATWRMPMHKITVSDWLLQLAREKFEDEVVSLVPNGVDLDQFYAPPRSKRAVPTVGLLHHHDPLKGCSVSIKALRRMAKAVPSLRAVSFGADQPHCGLKLPRFAEFHCRPPQDMLKDILRAM